MSANELAKVIDQLRAEETRWDAIVALKMMSVESDVPALIRYLSDPDWVVRWTVAEKLGDTQDPQAIPGLIKGLADEDFHVRKNASKALIKFGAQCLASLMAPEHHTNMRHRQQVLEVVKGVGVSGVSTLSDLIRDCEDWDMANFMLFAMYKVGQYQAESQLIEMLERPLVQKNTLIFLGELKSTQGIVPILRLYSVPKLRRLILRVFHHMGASVCVPYLVQVVADEELYPYAKACLLKMGTPSLPYMVHELAGQGPNKARLVQLIQKIGPSTIIKPLQSLSEKQPSLQPLLKTLLQVPEPAEKGKKKWWQRP